jgi:hypothetical protein
VGLTRTKVVNLPLQVVDPKAPAQAVDPNPVELPAVFVNCFQMTVLATAWSDRHWESRPLPSRRQYIEPPFFWRQTMPGNSVSRSSRRSPRPRGGLRKAGGAVRKLLCLAVAAMAAALAACAGRGYQASSYGYRSPDAGYNYPSSYYYSSGYYNKVNNYR